MTSDELQVSNRKHYPGTVVLVILFAVSSVILYSLYGVKHVNDSHRYLEYADHLSSGFYFEAHNFWYIGYPLFILLVRTVTGSTSEWVLILVQYGYGFVGFLFFLRILRHLDPQGIASIVGGLTYLILFEISMWNSYILCESFYFSTTVIALYFLTSVFLQGNRSVLCVSGGLLFALLTFLSKPTGIVFVMSLTGTFLLLRTKSWRFRRPALLLWGTGVGLLGLLFNAMLDTFLIIENYQLGEIVYGISTLPAKPEYQGLINPVPEELRILEKEYPPLIRLGHFVIANFGFWSLLFLKKLAYFLFHVRPFWSLPHNLFNLGLLIPLYVFVIQQLRHSRPEIRLFSILYLVFHTIIIGMTTVDWDGRFFLPMLPILIMLAALRISSTPIMRRLFPSK